MNCFHHLFVLSPILFKALNQKISKNIQPTRNLLVSVAPYYSFDIRIRNKSNEKEVPSNTALISIDTNNTSHLHELSLVHGGGNGYWSVPLLNANPCFEKKSD